MTLAKLIQKANKVQGSFMSAWIPLKYEGKDVDIDFDVAGDNEHGFVINMIITQVTASK